MKRVTLQIGFIFSLFFVSRELSVWNGGKVARGALPNLLLSTPEANHPDRLQGPCFQRPALHPHVGYAQGLFPVRKDAQVNLMG